MLGTKDGDQDIGHLGVVSILKFLVSLLLQIFNVLISFLLVLLHLLVNGSHVIIVLLQHILDCFTSLLLDFYVCLELRINLFLGLGVLSQEHVPTLDVIHGLILVRHQVPLNQGRIFHRDLLPSRFTDTFVQ